MAYFLENHRAGRQDRHLLLHEVPYFPCFGAISQVDDMFLLVPPQLNILGYFGCTLTSLTLNSTIYILLRNILWRAPWTASWRQDRVWASGKLFFSSFGNLSSAVVVRVLICSFVLAQAWDIFSFSCNHATTKILDWVDEIKLLSPHVVSSLMFSAAGIPFLSSSEQS